MSEKHKLNLTELVEVHTGELYSWALHKVSDAELAKDLVQDTFLAAAEKMDSFRMESSAKTWLFSILRNKIIDVYRKKEKQPVSFQNDDFSRFFDGNDSWKIENSPKDWHDEEQHLLDNKEFIQVLNHCLKNLPEKWYMSVTLKYLHEKSGDEICQELAISTTNYWQIMHRAKLQLRDCVEKYWL